MKRILIVDDAATVRLFNRQILEKAGYEVDEAINGIEALERSLLTTYDLYLVDVNMPLQDGFSFLSNLRAQAITQAPAVIISTEAGEQDRLQAWEAGANFYLIKPVKPDVLLQLVDMLTGEDDQ
ncbi:response regulator [Halomonas sp. McH1-25]|uniref:response regulator n=1 Tax=unclassified Halomonas TaxID=2609666 RepID=UPI001EF611A0|nr:MULTISPECIES: response regulator [unclassified Halomonas]MCG7601108.1 response regulator [Halomonas sp. McH1-25]MCP1342978.1 response regulator [Halomonas sp. FL8]MCP1360830.1 response regulator [Halomonas sp. BBD45]MCP1364428.1 response regulator [Halomonas sp. BBD48]